MRLEKAKIVVKFAWNVIPRRMCHPKYNARCILWAPLPIISWFIPFLGHVLLTDSHGMIYDFRGSFQVEKGYTMMNGPPLLELPLGMSIDDYDWDTVLMETLEEYSLKYVNFIINLCETNLSHSTI